MADLDRRTLLFCAAAASVVPIRAHARSASMRGYNLIETEVAPFGSPLAQQSFERAAASGADTVALIPFLWQSRADDPGILLGDALPHERLRAGIRQARAAGLRVVVKPHIWVPHGWAGMVAMRSDADWSRWFEAFEAALLPLASLAEEEGAAQFVIGTEFRETVLQPHWTPLIEVVRGRFSGPLVYVAHGADEAERVPFWHMLDAVGVSMYPVLGRARDKGAWHRSIVAELGRVQAVSARVGKPVWVGEIGIRSARGATPRPWESAEERAAPVDLKLQADVIGAWLHELERIGPAATLVWRWFSDPQAGGANDTDFTVQNKPAQQVIESYWLRSGATGQG